MCTLINRPSFASCEMCGFPRGTSGSANGEAEQAKPLPSSPARKAWGHTAPSRAAPSPCTHETSPQTQSPGQQILASLRQKGDTPASKPPHNTGLLMTPDAATPDAPRRPRGKAGGVHNKPEPSSKVKVNAGHDILAALRRGDPSETWTGTQRQPLDPSQELLATLKSGTVEKQLPDSSQQLWALLNNGGDVQPQEAVEADWLFETVRNEKRKAARKGRSRHSGGGNRPVYSQA